LNNQIVAGSIDSASVANLKNDPDFASFIKGKTTNTKNVKGRLSKALEIIRVV